jgi:hypothetical protein
MKTKWIGKGFNHQKTTIALKIQGQIQPQMETHDLQNKTKLTS